MVSIDSRQKSALLGLFIGDAVASPVHWYYNRQQLVKDYGTITGYVKPKQHFPNSIMNLSNTGGAGRGSDKGCIIGDVINHGKKEFWKQGGNIHYHWGLEAGENTLEGQLTRLLLRTITKDNHEFTAASFVKEYVTFMTTPGSHNDTYASSCHRLFFQNWVQKIDPSECPGNDGHNVDSIDALTLTVPVILKYCGSEK
jgi:ADP-ribosyl-[dinitrogen reductase] hydrolase